MEQLYASFLTMGIKIRRQTFMTNYYPGSCDQCDMLGGGEKTIFYGLSPDHFILICDKCLTKKGDQIETIVRFFQQKTHFHAFDKTKKYSILGSDNSIEKDWHIDPRFIIFLSIHKSLYIPLIKENYQRLVDLRTLVILNDVKLTEIVLS